MSTMAGAAPLVSIPEETDKRILSLRKDERFQRCTYSEIARQLLHLALNQMEESKPNTTGA